MKNKNIALGLMSGTSCDGLTICALQLKPFRILAYKNYPYSLALQERLLQAASLRAPQLSALHMELGKLYAQKTKLFLKSAGLSPRDLLCAGMHGQTIYHGPQDTPANTLQLAEPSFLAELLGCPVVSHFRQRDMVLGGQGAPLIPFFDEIIFGRGTPKILLNLGGIANLSVVGKKVKTFGFDCGPANTLMDTACTQYLKQPFDKGGRRAALGQADISLVSKLLRQPFFIQKPPKSLDKNEFSSCYLHKYFSSFTPNRINDLLATLNYFTAAAVAKAIEQSIPAKYRREIIVSGGGAYNTTLLKNLRQLTHMPVVISSKYHIDPLAKEAAAFALMAAYALQGKSNHCPQATGARKKTILGQITL